MREESEIMADASFGQRQNRPVQIVISTNFKVSNSFWGVLVPATWII